MSTQAMAMKKEEMHDLIASEVKYHTLYYANFLNQLPSTEKKPRQDNQVSKATTGIFNYFENHDDSQFALKELRDVLTGDPEEERLRIVEAAAAILRQDIRSSVVETKSYPPPSKMLITENQEIPKEYLENLPNLDQLVQIFQEKNCPVQTLHKNGVRVLLAIYNVPPYESSIDNLRYTQFIKSTKLNKPVQLSNTPPTSAAAHQHISRVYYQVQTWLGYHIEPQERGWILRNEFLEPITTL
ncbi:uncharacterized protein TNIN_275051 [Trichonephila inaurata madagascariensis]|uniref:Uncharacterized protein n=1 Tax=Trichonephila inaurata madagascariensis TaxID=2747483 RepID=A0A8X6WWP1_9ARAC|nr:uncharacterized protein TNIN_275051 [Trichonephila inaurata madagascariensis]